MTEIKSALELALERTQNIEGNKEILVANERRNDGKRLASKFLNPTEETIDIPSEFKKLKNDDARLVREGFFETMIANLTLPNDGEYKSQLKLIEEGIHLVSKERRQIAYLFQQIDQFFEQLLQTKEQINEQLRAQYEPKLREKEQMLAQQTGSRIKLTPESDPEFMNLLSKNVARLESQYAQVLAQAKDELKRIVAAKL